MSTQHPNVLLIIADDQRHDTIAALGDPLIHTPTLDGLTRDGTAFTHAFTTVPICEPARAEVLTGCHSFHNHVVWFGDPIRPGLTLLPDALRDAGYHTIHVGKWHNDGHPRDKGYERVHRVYPNDNLNQPEYDTRFGHTFRFEEHGHEVQGHSTELYADAALEALERAPQDRPWFMYLALHSPHDPFQCPEPYASMYDAASMPLPPNYMPEHPFDNGVMLIRDEKLLPWPREQDAIRQYRARYYSMISHHDHHLGRVLDALDASGQTEDTLVIFTSDHGLAVGSHGLLGKENMYDHSVRVPLLMRGPHVPAQHRVTRLAHHVDLLPTICHAVGIEPPGSAQDGRSLLSLVHNPARTWRDSVFGAFRLPMGRDHIMRETQRMVRTERWKLVFYPLIGRYQLFDIEADPDELYDLLQPWRLFGAPFGYTPPTGPERAIAIAEELRARLMNWQRNVDDPAFGKVREAPVQHTLDAPPVRE